MLQVSTVAAYALTQNIHPYTYAPNHSQKQTYTFMYILFTQTVQLFQNILRMLCLVQDALECCL